MVVDATAFVDLGSGWSPSAAAAVAGSWRDGPDDVVTPSLERGERQVVDADRVLGGGQGVDDTDAQVGRVARRRCGPDLEWGGGLGDERIPGGCRVGDVEADDRGISGARNEGVGDGEELVGLQASCPEVGLTAVVEDPADLSLSVRPDEQSRRSAADVDAVTERRGAGLAAVAQDGNVRPFDTCRCGDRLDRQPVGRGPSEQAGSVVRAQVGRRDRRAASDGEQRSGRRAGRQRGGQRRRRGRDAGHGRCRARGGRWLTSRHDRACVVIASEQRHSGAGGDQGQHREPASHPAPPAPAPSPNGDELVMGRVRVDGRCELAELFREWISHR